MYWQLWKKSISCSQQVLTLTSSRCQTCKHVISVAAKSLSTLSGESSQGMADLRKSRLGKVQNMMKNAVIPFAYSYDVNTNAASLQKKYEMLENGCEDKEEEVSIAGRIMMRRFFGKLAFFELQDQSGSIQLYIDKNKLGNEFNNMKNWTDSGDIVGVKGTLKRTEKGELSVYVMSWHMLTKALYPLPDKYHGLIDIKKRYSDRSVDMIVNPEVRKTLKLRSKIIKSIRRYDSHSTISVSEYSDIAAHSVISKFSFSQSFR